MNYKKYIRAFALLFGGLTLIVLLLFLLVWVFEYRPHQKEVVFESQNADVITQDTITILTWNTGYAGLSSGMDFFYDGGRKVFESQPKVDSNLREIGNFLATSNADIILLQEIDIYSKRGHYTNQFEYYTKQLEGYHGYFVYNYNSMYVPVPLRQPMGVVRGGIAVFSKWLPSKVVRHQYPGGYDFPMSAFNLKRCYMSCEFKTPTGIITINNTHNSAFDDGEMRRAEMGYLLDTLYAQYSHGIQSITGGDWNQNPPRYVQSQQEVTDKYFSVKHIDSTLLEKGWQFAYDTLPTARYLYEPYNPGVTTTTLIDMFLTSPEMKVLEVRTLDRGFSVSDHNPVMARIALPHRLQQAE